MTLSEYFVQKEELLTLYLTSFFQSEKKKHKVNPLFTDALTRLMTYTLRGKHLRAKLAFLGYELFHRPDSTHLLPLASACELFESAFLIHDDIMDNDDLRRDMPAMHIQYLSYEKSQDMGKHLAMCVGDLAFFLGYDLLSKIKNEEITKNLVYLFSQELTHVALAQMQDLTLSAHPTIDAILTLYRFKTGRYSCGLPLVGGAMLAGAHKDDLDILWQIGEALGILYQIKDDELNLFGNKKDTGKPVGSDIREGKKTLYYYFLMKKADKKMRNTLLHIFENPRMAHTDISYVQHMVDSLDIPGDITAIQNTYQRKLKASVSTIQGKHEQKLLLSEFTHYILTRKR